MSPRVLQAFELFEDAEKSCWETLLNDHPAASKISTGKRKRAIQAMLRQLWAILHEKSVERGLSSARLRPMSLGASALSSCPLDGLLPFFHSGKRALNLIGDELKTTLPEDRQSDADAAIDELGTAFDLLVQWQIEASCKGCKQTPCCWGVVRQAQAVHRLGSNRRQLC